VNGRGRKVQLPLWLVALLAIIGFIATSSAQPVGFLWVALVSARLALIGRDVPLVGPGIRQALVAIAIGVTPQTVFLIYFNTECPNVATCAGAWEGRVERYEKLIDYLNDSLHQYLLPSFYIAGPVGLLMFWLTIRLPRLRALWNRTQGAARFVGIVLVGAGTFTLMSATASGQWQSDTRARLQSRLADEADAQMREALYQQTKLDVSQPNSQLLAAAVAVENTLAPLSNYDRLRMRSTISSRILDRSDLPPRVEHPTPDWDVTSNEARRRLPAATKAAQDADERAKAAHEELSQIISGSVMAAFGRIVQLEVLDELIDGVAERLADNIVANHRSLQKLADVLANVSVYGREAVRQAVAFDPSATFTEPLRQAVEKKPTSASAIPDRGFPRVRPGADSWQIEDLLHDRVEFHPRVHGL
jgi:hypothetical protein